MDPALTAVLSGAVGGALIQSIVGPMVSQARDRKSARAKVLEHIAEVENLRWAPSDAAEFKRAVLAVRASALVASAPYRLVNGYLMFAQIAHAVSDLDFEESGGHPESGGIPVPIADLASQSCKFLVAQLWYPHRLRIFRRTHAQELRDMRQFVLEDPAQKELLHLFKRFEENSFVI